MRRIPHPQFAISLFIAALTSCTPQTVLRGTRATAVPPLTEPKPASKQETPRTLALPIVFEENAGQFREGAAFVSRGRDHVLAIEAAQTTLSLRAGDKRHSLVMSVANACEDARPHGEDRYSGIVNYIHGNEPAHWFTGVRSYRKVRYDAIYPGVDLQFHGSEQELEYDFTVAPGARADVIALDFSGMDDLHIDDGGDLVLNVAGREISQRKPVAYQKSADGTRTPVNVSFAMRGKNRVGFTLGSYDRSRELVIDPVLVYSTPVVTSEITRVAVDSNGNIFLTGRFFFDEDISTTPGAAQNVHNGGLIFLNSDVYVIKLTPDANDFQFITYLGGTDYDEPFGLGVTSGGDVVVAGSTASFDFPVTAGAFMTAPHFSSQNPAPSSFVTRLSQDGTSLVFSSHLSGGTRISDLVVDSLDRPIMTGFRQTSRYFPTTLDVPDAQANFETAFVLRLTADGSRLDLSFPFAGRLQETNGRAIAVDASNNIYLAGVTTGAFFTGDLPVVNAAQPACAILSGTFCSDDAFLAKFTPDGQTIFATYWGGTGSEDPKDLAISPTGSATIVGLTYSDDFPLANARYAYKIQDGTGSDGFVATFSPTGLIEKSSYLDGNRGMTAKYNQQGRLFLSSIPGGNFTLSHIAVYNANLDAVFEYLCHFCDAHDSTVDSSGNFLFVGKNILMPTYPKPLTLSRSANTDEDVAHLSKIDMTAQSGSFRTRFSAIYPEGAPSTGGTQVMITGPYLIGGIQATRVLFDGVDATNVISAFQPGQHRPGMYIVYAETPPHAPGTVTVELLGPGLHEVIENGFSYVSPTPTISTVTPSRVLFPRNVDLTITGSGFAPGTRVFLVDPTDTSTGMNHPLSDVKVLDEHVIVARSTWEKPGTYGLRIELPYLNFPNNFVEVPGMFTADAPGVQTLSPNWGRVSGAAGIEIKGKGFVNGVAVLFDGVPGTVSNFVTGTFQDSFKVTAPPHAAGFVDVTIQNPGLQDVVIPHGFRYVDEGPRINSLQPTHGPAGGGTSLTIVGLNFHSDDLIQIDGIVVTNKLFIDANTWLVTTPPHHPGPYAVIVTSQQGAGSSWDFNQTASSYTYDGLYITSVSPNQGPIAGGTSVTINGYGIVSGATVKFGGVSAPVNPQCCGLRVTSPAHAAGQVDVEVTNPDGSTSVVKKGFLYVGAAPTVSQVTPNSGGTGGGTAVTITGTNFLPGAAVTFDTTNAHNVAYVNDTTLTALTPNHAAGLVNVKVTNFDGQTGTLTGAYTYKVGPAIDSITPPTGSSAGGTAVTITGANFDPAIQVTFGGVAAATVTWQSASQLIATTPPHVPADVDVMLTNPDTLSATALNGFRFLAPAPTLSGFTPTTGPPATDVTITGTNFQFVTDVKFFNNASATFTVDSTTQITAKVPNTAATGPITVTTQSGSATSSSDFTVQSIAPIVTNFTPTGGGAGTVVTITGSRFTGATSVKFGGVATSTFTVNNDTQITATAPNGTTGPICVTTPGPFTGCSAADFTFPPRVTGFTPPQGLPGTNVTISGVNFQGATAVNFNGAAASSFTVNSPSSITATVPAGATTGPVSVTTPAGSGTSSTSFGVPPAITNFTPQRGGAGYNVTISGVRFTGVTAVRFGTLNATFTFVDDATINATAPAGVVTAPISVTTNGGTATSSSNFIVAAIPSITGFSPTKGAPGTVVTFTGTNLSTAVSVKFNGADAVFTIVNDSSLTATVPNTATNGPISITNDQGTTTTSAIFSLPPVLSSFAPNAGSAGSSVTINGNNFVGTTGVTFNGTAAVFTVNAQDRITTTVPSGATTGKLTVTTGYGPVSSVLSFTILSSGTPTLIATATGANSVALTWSGNSGASYQVRRITTKSQTFDTHVIATVTGNSYTDLSVAAGTTYIYDVYNTATGQISNNDYATTIIFTDDPLVAGTTIKAVHLTEIRAAANALRVAAGLAPATWTDSAPAGLTVRAVHITEVRNAIRDALISLGRYASFSDASLTSGIYIRGAHMIEMREAVK